MVSVGYRPLITVKQQAFVDEYLKDMNAAQAYIRAGYSPRGAHHHSSRLLKIPVIQQALTKAIHDRRQRTQIEQDDIIRELARIAMVDLGDLYDATGNLLPIKSMPEDARRALAGIDTDELIEGHGDNRTFLGVTRKVKTHDKIAALKLLGMHLKMFAEQHEVTVTVALADRLKAARERAKR